MALIPPAEKESEGEVADSDENPPVPDPTSLTTESLLREIGHLRELMESKDRASREHMGEMDLRYQQRFDAGNKALDTALSSAKEAVSAALVAAEKAVSKAEMAAEKRFDAVAEFRDAYQQLVSGQMPREEAENRLKAVTDKLEDHKASTALFLTDVSNRLATDAGRQTGIKMSAGTLMAAMSAAVMMISIIIFMSR